MKVYTYFDSSPAGAKDCAEQVRLWVRRWKAEGWEPRLLTSANARRSKLKGKTGLGPLSLEHLSCLAFHSIGGGWYSRTDGFPPGKPFRPRNYTLTVEDGSFFFVRRDYIDVFCNQWWDQCR